MKLVAIVAALALSSAVQVDAHAWLVKPVSRETSAVEDAAGTMGCPTMSPGQFTSVQPGQKLDVRYPRNNHIGGFIRWAIVPRGQESKQNFDDNVFSYTCRESGSTCIPPGTNDVFAGDNGAPANSILCGDTITLPNHLPAGDYVLQWTWMSVGSSYGNIAEANPQYRSCADLKFTAAGSGSKPSCPTFTGGDRVGKLQGKGSDQCFYFRDNDIVSSVFKGDNKNYQQYYKFGVPAQVAKCSGGSGGAAPAPGPAPRPALRPATGPPQGQAPPTGNGTVKPPGALKREWQFCSANSECANGCCANKLSDDGKMKCTPGGC